MQETFLIYFRLGIEHILDPKAYDHLLFVVAIASVFSITAWKQLFWTISSFTLGHSISLAFAVLGWFYIDSKLIEFLIPLSILSTAIFNIYKSTNKQNPLFNYLLTGFFGLIHGLGFSNYLKQLLINQQELLWPLFSFNLGIEAGQIGIVLVFLALFSIGYKLSWFKPQPAIWVLNAFIAGISFVFVQNNYPF